MKQGYDAVYPTAVSSAGEASVGFSLTRDILHRTSIFIGEERDTEMVWGYLEKVPQLKFVILPGENRSAKIRLTLDYIEDYWLLCSVQRIVGTYASRAEIDLLFRRNPDLYKINWFRNQEWKAVQLAKCV